MSTAYTFNPVEACNMCGAGPDRFKVLGLRLNRSQGRDPANVTGAGVTVVRCRGCGLIFPNPQPRPGSILDHYGVSAEEYWEDERIDGQPPASLIAHYAMLRQLLSDRPNPVALDVGFGLGLATRALIAAGFEVHGTEPGPQFRERAMRTLAIPPERIRGDDIETASYPADSFDLVNFSAVLEHVYDPLGALEKSLGWLRPGGLIACEVPSSDWLVAKITNLFFRLKRTDYVTHVSPMHSPYHMYEFTTRAFEACGARIGFEVERVDFEVCTDPFLPRIAQKVLHPIMEATKTGMQMHATLRKLG